MPEPWASRLVLEAGAKVLLDEKDLWPDGEFVTTNIIVAQPFLNKYPGTVRSILQANNSAIEYIARTRPRPRTSSQAQINKRTGRPLPDAVITRPGGTSSPEPPAHDPGEERGRRGQRWPAQPGQEQARRASTT